ncbi:MAG TPA: hypothetical protein VH575_21545 [Gemmataceae bacterium]
MERFNKLRIVLAALLLAWLQPSLGRAQPQAPPPAREEAEPTIPSPRRTTSPDAAPPRGVTERTQFPQRLELPAQPSKKSPLEKPPPADGEVVKLDLPPLEAGDLRYPINLATALRLSDARPLIIASAQASAWVAEAELQKAKVLWLPDFNLGFDYIRHDGNGPDTLRGVNIPAGQNALGQFSPTNFGRPQDQNINFFYTGGGTFIMRNATDMIFEPLAARQNLNAKRWDIQTAKNDALLMTARAYFDVHKYRGQYAGAIYVVRRARQLVEAIDHLAGDLVQAVEVDRARTLLADLSQQAVTHRQQWRRSSANLTQVLRLDPRAVVEPLERDHLQITLIDPSRALDDLMPIGLTNRPELAGHQAEVQAALVRIRQEKLRPFLPVLMINGFQTPYEQINVGAFAIGSGGKLINWTARDDIGPQALWQFDALGLGNMAMVKWRRGEASQATIELFKVQDMVAADVTRAQARLQSAAARVVQAERELRGALNNYNGSYEGLQQTQRFGNVLQLIARPQEAVFALKLLKLAFDDYYVTVAEYNIAQFEMFHALGYPAREIAFFHRTGEVLPVDTSRPGSLPPVGTGPPPPTR